MLSMCGLLCSVLRGWRHEQAVVLMARALAKTQSSLLIQDLTPSDREAGGAGQAGVGATSPFCVAGEEGRLSQLLWRDNNKQAVIVIPKQRVDLQRWTLFLSVEGSVPSSLLHNSNQNSDKATENGAAESEAEEVVTVLLEATYRDRELNPPTAHHVMVEHLSRPYAWKARDVFGVIVTTTPPQLLAMIQAFFNNALLIDDDFLINKILTIETIGEPARLEDPMSIPECITPGPWSSDRVPLTQMELARSVSPLPLGQSGRVWPGQEGWRGKWLRPPARWVPLWHQWSGESATSTSTTIQPQSSTDSDRRFSSLDPQSSYDSVSDYPTSDFEDPPYPVSGLYPRGWAVSGTRVISGQPLSVRGAFAKGALTQHYKCSIVTNPLEDLWQEGESQARVGDDSCLNPALCSNGPSSNHQQVRSNTLPRAKKGCVDSQLCIPVVPSCRVWTREPIGLRERDIVREAAEYYQRALNSAQDHREWVRRSTSSASEEDDFSFSSGQTNVVVTREPKNYPVRIRSEADLSRATSIIRDNLANIVQNYLVKPGSSTSPESQALYPGTNPTIKLLSVEGDVETEVQLLGRAADECSFATAFKEQMTPLLVKLEEQTKEAEKIVEMQNTELRRSSDLYSSEGSVENQSSFSSDSGALKGGADVSRKRSRSEKKLVKSGEVVHTPPITRDIKIDIDRSEKKLMKTEGLVLPPITRDSPVDIEEEECHPIALVVQGKEKSGTEDTSHHPSLELKDYVQNQQTENQARICVVTEPNKEAISPKMDNVNFYKHSDMEVHRSSVTADIVTQESCKILPAELLLKDVMFVPEDTEFPLSGDACKVSVILGAERRQREESSIESLPSLGTEDETSKWAMLESGTEDEGLPTDNITEGEEIEPHPSVKIILEADGATGPSEISNDGIVASGSLEETLKSLVDQQGSCRERYTLMKSGAVRENTTDIPIIINGEEGDMRRLDEWSITNNHWSVESDGLAGDGNGERPKCLKNAHKLNTKSSTASESSFESLPYRMFSSQSDSLTEDVIIELTHAPPENERLRAARLELIRQERIHAISLMVSTGTFAESQDHSKEKEDEDAKNLDSSYSSANHDQPETETTTLPSDWLTSSSTEQQDIPELQMEATNMSDGEGAQWCGSVLDSGVDLMEQEPGHVSPAALHPKSLTSPVESVPESGFSSLQEVSGQEGVGEGLRDGRERGLCSSKSKDSLDLTETDRWLGTDTLSDDMETLSSSVADVTLVESDPVSKEGSSRGSVSDPIHQDSRSGSSSSTGMQRGVSVDDAPIQYSTGDRGSEHRASLVSENILTSQSDESTTKPYPESCTGPEESISDSLSSGKRNSESLLERRNSESLSSSDTIATYRSLDEDAAKLGSLSEQPSNQQAYEDDDPVETEIHVTRSLVNSVSLHDSIADKLRLLSESETRHDIPASRRQSASKEKRISPSSTSRKLSQGASGSDSKPERLNSSETHRKDSKELETHISVKSRKGSKKQEIPSPEKPRKGSKEQEIISPVKPRKGSKEQEIISPEKPRKDSEQEITSPGQPRKDSKELEILGSGTHRKDSVEPEIHSTGTQRKDSKEREIHSPGEHRKDSKELIHNSGTHRKDSKDQEIQETQRKDSKVLDKQPVIGSVTEVTDSGTQRTYRPTIESDSGTQKSEPSDKSSQSRHSSRSGVSDLEDEVFLPPASATDSQSNEGPSIPKMAASIFVPSTQTVKVVRGRHEAIRGSEEIRKVSQESVKESQESDTKEIESNINGSEEKRKVKDGVTESQEVADKEVESNRDESKCVQGEIKDIPERQNSDQKEDQIQQNQQQQRTDEDEKKISVLLDEKRDYEVKDKINEDKQENSQEVSKSSEGSERRTSDKEHSLRKEEKERENKRQIKDKKEKGIVVDIVPVHGQEKNDKKVKKRKQENRKRESSSEEGIKKDEEDSHRVKSSEVKVKRDRVSESSNSGEIEERRVIKSSQESEEGWIVSQASSKSSLEIEEGMSYKILKSSQESEEGGRVGKSLRKSSQGSEESSSRGMKSSQESEESSGRGIKSSQESEESSGRGMKSSQESEESSGRGMKSSQESEESSGRGMKSSQGSEESSGRGMKSSHESEEGRVSKSLSKSSQESEESSSRGMKSSLESEEGRDSKSLSKSSQESEKSSSRGMKSSHECEEGRVSKSLSKSSQESEKSSSRGMKSSMESEEGRVSKSLSNSSQESEEGIRRVSPRLRKSSQESEEGMRVSHGRHLSKSSQESEEGIRRVSPRLSRSSQESEEGMRDRVRSRHLSKSSQESSLSRSSQDSESGVWSSQDSEKVWSSQEGKVNESPKRRRQSAPDTKPRLLRMAKLERGTSGLQTDPMKVQQEIESGGPQSSKSDSPELRKYGSEELSITTLASSGSSTSKSYLDPDLGSVASTLCVGGSLEYLKGSPHERRRQRSNTNPAISAAKSEELNMKWEKVSVKSQGSLDKFPHFDQVRGQPKPRGTRRKIMSVDAQPSTSHDVGKEMQRSVTLPSTSTSASMLASLGKREDKKKDKDEKGQKKKRKEKDKEGDGGGGGGGEKKSAMMSLKSLLKRNKSKEKDLSSLEKLSSPSLFRKLERKSKTGSQSPTPSGTSGTSQQGKPPSPSVPVGRSSPHSPVVNGKTRPIISSPVQLQSATVPPAISSASFSDSDSLANSTPQASPQASPQHRAGSPQHRANCSPQRWAGHTQPSPRLYKHVLTRHLSSSQESLDSSQISSSHHSSLPSSPHGSPHRSALNNCASSVSLPTSPPAPIMGTRVLRGSSNSFSVTIGFRPQVQERQRTMSEGADLDTVTKSPARRQDASKILTQLNKRSSSMEILVCGKIREHHAEPGQSATGRRSSFSREGSFRLHREISVETLFEVPESDYGNYGEGHHGSCWSLAGDAQPSTRRRAGKLSLPHSMYLSGGREIAASNPNLQRCGSPLVRGMPHSSSFTSSPFRRPHSASAVFSPAKRGLNTTGASPANENGNGGGTSCATLMRVEEEEGPNRRNVDTVIDKPPNVLVYAANNVEYYSAVCNTLNACLNVDRYIVYHLTDELAFKSPWCSSTTLLVVCGDVPAHVSTAFIRYLLQGGRILSICSDFLNMAVPLFGTVEVQEQAVVSVSYKQWTSVQLLHHQHCFHSSPQHKRFSRDVEGAKTDGQRPGAVSVEPTHVEITDEYGGHHRLNLSVLATDDTWAAPTLLSAKLHGGQGSAIFSQVHLERDPRECYNAPNAIAKPDPADAKPSAAVITRLTASNQSRLEMLRDLLATELGLDTSLSTTAASPHTPAYFLGRHELKESLLTQLRPHLVGEELKRPDVTVQFVKTGNTPGQASDHLLPILTSACPLTFSTVKYFEALNTSAIGRLVIYCDVMTSSMKVTAGHPPLIHGIVVLPSQQTQGKGRGGNAWVSALGCAMFSTQLHVDLGSTLGQHLSFLQHLVALAIVRAVRDLPQYAHIPLVLKWPNDIYLGPDIKIGGVVVEATTLGSQVIANIGCGVNLSNSNPTTCINDAIRQHNLDNNSSLPEIDRETFLARTFNILEELIEAFQARGPGAVQPQYYKYWLHSNATVTVQSEHRQTEAAVIVGVDDYGFLQAQLVSGTIITLTPDGNSFNMMEGLVYTKTK